MTTKAAIVKAKKIAADIYNLTGAHKQADWELNKATDSIYKYIKELEAHQQEKND